MLLDKGGFNWTLMRGDETRDVGAGPCLSTAGQFTCAIERAVNQSTTSIDASNARMLYCRKRGLAIKAHPKVNKRYRDFSTAIAHLAAKVFNLHCEQGDTSRRCASAANARSRCSPSDCVVGSCLPGIDREGCR